MNKSFWGVFVIMLGVTALILIVLFQNITNADEHNSQLLKEVTEAAMWDAYQTEGIAFYRQNGIVHINEEKFVENFIRRFADSANSSSNYKIEIFDVNETPPKVSIRVTSTVASSPLRIITGNNEEHDYTINLNNYIDAILETPY